MLWHAMTKRKIDVGESSQASKARPSEGVGGDLVLEPKHKIFLSHSGAQKDFVEYLCEALETRCHYPFFDKRPESLPKGKEYPGLIIKAAQQCKLFVVVVSEEYFMSRWPMIELDAFVQAKKRLKSNVKVDILPLFFGLSVSDLKDEERRQRWLEKWKTFAEDDRVEGRIKVDDWIVALEELTNFSGLNRESKGFEAYRDEIVSHICALVLPDIKWHDSHVQGNAHKVVLEKMEQIESPQASKAKVVGIYGVGGIGKTTICKTLCNELSNEYDGRVCYVDVGNTCSNSKELLQKVALKLTRKNENGVHQWDEGECENVLHNNLRNQKTFLAIDNVWDNNNSLKQAKMFLDFPSRKDSLVVVTARSQSTLAGLQIDGDACLEMPELGQADATSLFLHHANNGKEFPTRKDMESIGKCVEKCYFCKGDGRSYHYHPLALEALGRQLFESKEKPSKWEDHLSKIWETRFFSGENGVFDVLRTSFELLQSEEQTLFMDVALFLLHIARDEVHYLEPLISVKEKLCVVHGKDESWIQSQLDSLKRKGLLQDVDLTLGWFTMHDLYHEFVTQELGGKPGETLNMEKRKWVLVGGIDGDLSKLKATPAGRCWPKLSRLSIHLKEEDSSEDEELDYCPPANAIESLEGIEWQNFSNVCVLHLWGLKFVEGSLNLKGMTLLQSLQLYNLKCLERLEGLESLQNLTCFEWLIPSHGGDSIPMTHFKGQFPASIKYVYIEEQCELLGSSMLARCKNLIKLKLQGIEVGDVLDLTNCSALEVVDIGFIESLETLKVPTTSRPSRLHTLKIQDIDEIQIRWLDQLDGLLQLEVFHCRNLLEASSMLSLTSLQTLEIDTHSEPLDHWIPHQLQELHYRDGNLREAPCLNAFKKLQVLNLSLSRWMTRMDGMGNLSALRSLDLSGCSSLKRVPTLSESRSLQELILDDCSELELYEEDFIMLSELCSLHPVRFSSMRDRNMIKVDVGERKVLRYQGSEILGPTTWLRGKEEEWEKLELGLLPIKIGKRFVGDTYLPIKS